MKTILLLIILNILDVATHPRDPIKCLIQTTLGDIVIELYPGKAPVTVKNFLYYADHRLYDGSSFYRVCTPENEAGREITIEVVQGGDVPEEKSLPPIPLETTAITKILHKDGTVSMARDTPHSATSSFFICIGDQPELDHGGKRHPDGQGFAAFGQVISGMETVRKIQQQKNTDQYLTDPVEIVQIRRIE